MASSSNTFGVVSLVLLSFFLVSASASTKFIDAICQVDQYVTDKASCIQTLNAYPSAVSATSMMQAAKATLRLAKSHAVKSAAFARKAAKENPNLKKQFEASQESFVDIKGELLGAAYELKEDPLDANYSVMICYDQTRMVSDMFEKNTDKASKNIMMLTYKMNQLIAIAVGATVAVGG